MTTQHNYESQAARDAAAGGYGGPDYWAYLDESAKRHRDYFLARGDVETARRMMARDLGEALRGNDGA